MKLGRNKALTFTFERGIHPNEKKDYTRHMPINTLLPAAGSEIIIPLLQHMGAV